MKYCGIFTVILGQTLIEPQVVSLYKKWPHFQSIDGSIFQHSWVQIMTVKWDTLCIQLRKLHVVRLEPTISSPLNNKFNKSFNDKIKRQNQVNIGFVRQNHWLVHKRFNEGLETCTNCTNCGIRNLTLIFVWNECFCCSQKLVRQSRQVIYQLK